MSSAAQAALPSPSYEEQFRIGIKKNIEYVLQRMEQITSILPRDLEELVLHALDLALRLDEAWPVTRRVLLIIAPLMEQAGYRDEWMAYLERGIDQSQRLDDGATEAELRIQLGILLRLRGRLDDAEAHFTHSERYFAAAHAPQAVVRAMNHRASTLRLQGHHDEATVKAQAALRLADLNNPQRAYSYLILGMVALDRRELSDAENHLRQAHAIWQREGTVRMVAWTLTNLGAVLQTANRLDEAQAAYDEAIALFRTVNDPVHLAVAQMNLGNVHLSRDEYEDALELYLVACRVFLDAEDRPRLAQVEHNLGLACYYLGDWGEAIDHFMNALEGYKLLNNLRRTIHSLDGLVLAYKARDEFSAARRSYEEAMTLLEHLQGAPDYDYLRNMLQTNMQD